MVQLNCASMPRAYLPSIPHTKITNEENCFWWLWQCLPWFFKLFFTNPEAPPLAHIFSNPRQRHQLWRQSSCLPSSLCSYRSPDWSPYLFWYSLDGLGVRRVLILRWVPVRQGKVVRHALCCDALWQGLLCCSQMKYWKYETPDHTSFSLVWFLTCGNA